MNRKSSSLTELLQEMHRAICIYHFVLHVTKEVHVARKLLKLLKRNLEYVDSTVIFAYFWVISVMTDSGDSAVTFVI